MKRYGPLPILILSLLTLNAHAQQTIPSVGGSSSGGTSFNVTSPTYGAVADGSTNNSTAITKVFTASNATSSGIPTVYFPCQTGKQCQYNYTDGGSTSPINPTIPTTIQCDPGVILNDTGSAHMIDIGNGSSSYLKPFRVTGCQFTGSSVTAGVYINAGTGTTYNESGSIDHNTFYDLPSGSTAITGTGHIYNWLVDENTFSVDNATAGSFLNIGSISDEDNQVTAHHNLIYCAGGSPTSVVNCTSAGVGILVGGVGSMVTDNFIVTMNPDIQVTQYGAQSHITGNNLENAPFGTHAAILYGQSGDASNTAVTGVVVDNNWTDMHTSAPFIAAASANDLVKNWDAHDNKFSGTNPTSLISENAASGQTGNISSANQCLSGPCLNSTGLVTANVITPEPWLNLSSETYADTFHRSNGVLVSPWIGPAGTTVPSITSNVATCAATCFGLYSNDISVNQTNGITLGTAPTGTDSAYVQTRFTTAAASALSDYECGYTAGTGIQLYAVVAGTATQLGSTYTTVTPVNGDSIFLESNGASQTCYLRHAGVTTAVIGPIADTTVTAGYGGMLIIGTSGTISLFTEKGTP